MKVTVKDVKTGKDKAMPKVHADILVKLGRATYITRDMVADSVPTAPLNKDGTPKKRPGRRAQAAE